MGNRRGRTGRGSFFSMNRRMSLARIRYLKPDFFKDEDLAELPFQTRLFYAGLWCLADREGRLEDRPKRLKAEIFPYEKADTEDMLQSLAKPKTSGNPYILRYEADGFRCIQILSWSRHQKPHHTEKDSFLPPIPPSLLNTKGMGNLNQLEASAGLNNVPLTVKNTLKTKHDEAKEVINHLNSKTGKSFRITDSNLKFVLSRLSDGFSLSELKNVIDKKAVEWSGTDMDKYLRPETLFNATKFQSYLNEKEPESKNARKMREIIHGNG